MPNPNIPLMLKPTVQQDDLATIQQRNLALSDLRDQRHMRQIQMQETERGLQEQGRLRAIFRDNPDLEQAIPKVMQVNPTMGLALQNKFIEQRKAAMENQLQQLKVWREQAEGVAQITARIYDEQSKREGIREAFQKGLIDQRTAEQYMQMPWGPGLQQEILALQKKALSQKDKFDLDFKQLTEAREAEKHKWAQQRQPFEQQNLETEALTNGLNAAGRTVNGVSDQPSYDAWRATQPEAVRAKLPAKYSPAAVEIVQRMSMTSGEQAANADRDASRTQAADFHKDQVRHQDRMYGLAASNAKATQEFRKLALAASQGKTSADYKSKVQAIASLDQSLADYRDELKKTGPTMRTGSSEGSRLQTKFIHLQMQIKNVYELGALAGPDMELLNKAVTDPTSLMGNFGGNPLDMTRPLLEQLSVYDSVVTRMKNNLAAAYERDQKQNGINAAKSAAEMSNADLVNLIGLGK